VRRRIFGSQVDTCSTIHRSDDGHLGKWTGLGVLLKVTEMAT
jgi:hypothetical protein